MNDAEALQAYRMLRENLRAKSRELRESSDPTKLLVADVWAIVVSGLDAVDPPEEDKP